LFLAALCVAWAANPTPAAAQGGIPVHDLQCEKATNPRGVTVAQPQFSWVFDPKSETAYQILVASSEEKLKADDGDLWDSGKVVGNAQTARYQGKALSSLQRCYWKIQVWGSYYSAMGYSEPASWQMGLLFFDKPKAK
jgi:alpha-L-rhamnosidase